MKINLNGKVFKSVLNSENGEVDGHTLFFYSQNGEIIHADYEGGEILKGHLIGRISKEGIIDMRYHHLNISKEFMIGKCRSTPEVLEDGRLKFREEWQWITGDQSAGYSEIEEVIKD